MHQHRRFVVFTAVALGALACSGDAGMAPPMARSASVAATKGGVPAAKSTAARAAQCDTKTMADGAGDFGPSGGTLLFGTSRLIIPPGALHESVRISATTLDGDNSRVEFQPEGLQFAKPAGLLLDVSGCALEPGVVPDVVYLSETGVVLETIPAVYDPRLHTFAARIDHFSGYAIAF